MTSSAIDSGINPEVVTVLREILADPAPPFGSAADDPDSIRHAALREAHDYLSSRRILAGSAVSAARADALLADLTRADPVLGATLGRHAAIAGLLAGLAPGRGRNALLGDIDRGELVTWATTVHSWAWRPARPSAAEPIAQADAVFELDHSPGLFDTVVVWEAAASALIVVPTHRARIAWQPVESSSRERWSVRLSGVTFHVSELISVPGELPDALLRD